jgi:hypothetical protein
MANKNQSNEYVLAIVVAVALAAVLIGGMNVMGFLTIQSGTSALTVTSTVAITLQQGTVNLGSLTQGQTNQTSGVATDNRAFNLTNDGNVKVNVTINATNLWNTTANPTANYQYAVNNTTQGNCYQMHVNTMTSWTNMYAPTVPTTFLVFLNFTDTCDSAKAEIKVTVPSNEPTGFRTSMVTFVANEA